jgi:cellulose biosynthesis protein BcsQ
MRKIGFQIAKGGVGKTTSAGHIALGVSLRGKKVLAVDADPQGNLTSWLSIHAPKYELSDVLNEIATLEQAIIPLTGNLSLLPTFAHGSTLRDFAELKLLQRPFTFRALVKNIETLGFDFVVFDMSPGSSSLEKMIIAALDEIITPLTPEFFSVDGLTTFVETLSWINKNLEGNVKHERIILNNFNRSFAQHLLFSEEIKRLKYHIYTIAQERPLADGQKDHLTAWDIRSKNIPEFERLAADLLGV